MAYIGNASFMTRSEIQYNLEILRGQRDYPSDEGGYLIKPEQINAIAFEFLQIFANQMNQLPNQRSRQVTRLRQSFERSEMYVCKNLSCSDVVVPLVGKEFLLPGDLARENPALSKELARLPQTAHIRKIRGDGHCLFRSIAWNIVFHRRSGKMISTLMALKEAYPALKTDIKRMVKVLQSKDSPYHIMSDHQRSNIVVAGLRKIACVHNASRRAIVGYSLADLKNMADMSKAYWGGQPEIQALAEALNVQIDVYNLADSQGSFPHVLL